MDAAYKNASERRAALSKEIADLTAQVEERKLELAQVDAFLNEWARYAGVMLPPQIDSHVPVPETARRSKRNNPSKESVGDRIEVFLRERGAPMSRGSLFAALESEGIVLEGTDPQMVLSTMLWRMKDRFIRVKGKGYWLTKAQVPLESDDNEAPEAV